MKSHMTRRNMLAGLASVGAAGFAQSRLAAQSPHYLRSAPLYPPIRVRSMNSMGITVSERRAASVEWYQHVFGMPVQYTQDRSEGRVAILALGSGPEHLALYPRERWGNRVQTPRLGCA